MNTEQINTILYNIDPMSTTCKKYNIKDEYSNEAALILELIKTETPFNAVKTVFDQQFYTDCLSQQQITEITNLFA